MHRVPRHDLVVLLQVPKAYSDATCRGIEKSHRQYALTKCLGVRMYPLTVRGNPPTPSGVIRRVRQGEV